MPTSRLPVRVTPGARRDEITGFAGGVLRVRVIAPPERGRANEAVIFLLAKALGIPKSNITLLRGVASRDKLLGIEGLTDREVRARLQAAGHDGAHDLKHDDRHHR